MFGALGTIGLHGDPQSRCIALSASTIQMTSPKYSGVKLTSETVPFLANYNREYVKQRHRLLVNLSRAF